MDVRYPLPLIQNTVRKLEGKKFHAKLDLSQGFHQLRVAEESKWLTAFVILNSDGNICIVFIDDIDAYGDTWEEFLVNVDKVLTRLEEKRVVVKLKKCFFGTPEVEFLGHIVNSTGIRLSTKRTQAVLDMPIPTDTHKLRRFLGLCNSFRDYIPNFAWMEQPLNKLAATKKNGRFSWLDEHTVAYESLKVAVSRCTQLFFLTYTDPIILRTDASNIGIGAVLLQISKGKEQPIMFLSKTFSDVATRWPTIEQEAFAIFWSITSLESYLLGQFFHVETDHRNLVYIDSALSPKIIRWRLRLQEYDFQIVHIPGKNNVVADALSRCFMTRIESFDSNEVKSFDSDLSILPNHDYNAIVNGEIDDLTRAEE
jgi:hypothetical protein